MKVEELAISKERNRVVCELHDSLGYSLKHAGCEDIIKAIKSLFR